MAWSQFSIKIFGVHFGNPVLDNSNWDKISHSLTKKWHPCGEGGAHLRISFCHLLMNFENPWKIRLLKKWKICWRYHHFTHVPKTTIIWGTVPEIGSETEFFFILGHFFALLTTQKTKVLKKWKKHPEMLSF